MVRKSPARLCKVAGPSRVSIAMVKRARGSRHAHRLRRLANRNKKARDRASAAGAVLLLVLRAMRSTMARRSRTR
ncbi:MAG TPA: hypothetical protein VE970_05910 [Pseudolabrys sp.]|nr:hypothetical protein [Pseudolabrys sp.]